MKSSFRSSPRSRIVYTSQDIQRPITTPANWEIFERIESCEIRCKTSTETCSIDKMSFWRNCCSEILPLIKKDFSDIASAINRVIKGIFSMFDTVNEDWAQREKKKTEEVKDYVEEVKQLKAYNYKLKAELEKYEKINLDEKVKIKSEVEDMFGADDNEIRELRLRSKKIVESKPSAIVGMLRDIYASMAQERYMPDYKEIDIDSPNPDDIANAFNFNYHLLIQSTTKKVMNMLKKEVQTSENCTQTHVLFMSGDEYEDMVKRFEKNNISLQSALMQIDKLKEEIISRGINSEKLEQEKNQYFHEMLKFKRDSEAVNKELLSLKREFATVSIHFEKTTRELEIKNKEVLRKEEKIQSQTLKIAKLTQIKRNSELEVPKPQNDIQVEAETESLDRQFTQSNYDNFRRASAFPDYRRPRLGSNIDYSALDPNKSLYKKYPGSISNYTSNSSLPPSNDHYQEGINNMPGFRESKRMFYPTNKDIAQAPTKSSSIKDEFKEPSHEKATEKYSEIGDSVERIDKIQERKNKAKKMSKIKQSKKNKREINGEGKSPDRKNDGRKNSFRRESLKSESMKEEAMKSVGHGTKGDFDTHESYNEIGGKRQIVRDGNILELVDRANNTHITLQAGISVAVQYNYDQLNKSESNDQNSLLCMMPFNPNNVFGLKGDVFYNSSSRVFGAHSKMSEVVKNTNYKMDKAKAQNRCN
ncbi:hypothetical protein SteCoe_3495 [Stentor coeruleus]|uniref:Uncharacterized protein n=1 Tax=Stentor coeruleus TaxID=5963 RepID=A0A1R2CWY0_9CILI|nr:hypothetical protein SteCoe_3495 [Stentor coeruleus]